LQFTDGERSIVFDMRLGPEMAIRPSAEDLVTRPDLPWFEVDAQVLDHNGQPFFQQMGGDGYIDPTWSAPAVEGFDEATRQNDFEMLKAAAAPVRNYRAPEELDQLRLAILSIANSVDGFADKSGVDTSAIARVAPCELCRGGAAVTKWDFYTSVHPVAVLGEHSAVMLRGWTSNSRVAYTTVSCNHGSCANASDMKRKCTMPGFRTDDGSHTRWFQANGCSTHYNARSAGGHNCNDDSELQQRAIWNDRYQSTTANECNDFAGIFGCQPTIVNS
jgi:hypothetical protein